jgi:protein phosphatase 1L
MMPTPELTIFIMLAQVVEVNLHCNQVAYACSYWTEKGGRPYQEDRFEMCKGSAAADDSSVYAVFDGHGGDKAAQYCKDNLLRNVLAHKAFDDQVAMALRSAFAQTDNDFSALARENNMTDGTTAVVATVHGGKLVVANAGDSRCILIKKGGKVVPMSDDHKPSRDDEVARIRDLGGKVLYWGRWRVQGVLAVSRAIGDVNLKPYVTSEPELVERRVEPDDQFLVLASDGLWDVMTNEDVAKFVVRSREFKDVARALCHEAMLLGSADNVTALVVDLRSRSTSAVASSPESIG